MNLPHKMPFFVILGALAARSETVHLSLQDAVSRALANGHDLETPELAIEGAKARTNTARTAYMPTFTGVGTYSYSDPVSNSYGRNTVPHDVYDVHLNASWLLCDFGRRDVDERKAAHQETIAAEQRNAIRQAIQFKVVSTYAGIVYDDIAIRVQDSLIGNLDRHLDNMVERLASGSAVEFDTLKTAVRIAGIRSQNLSILNDRSHRLIQLRQWLDLRPSDSISVLEFPIRVSPPPRGLDSLIGVANGSREEMKLAKALEHAAELNLEASRKTNHPSLVGYVNAGVKDGYNIPHSTTEAPFLNGTIGFQVNAPIWDGGKRNSQKAEANVALSIARDSAKHVVRKISLDVQIALEDLDASYQQIILSDITVRQTEAAVKMAQARYESGSATNLDYLDAASELSQARLQQCQYRFRYYLSAMSLRQALGMDPLER